MHRLILSTIVLLASSSLPIKAAHNGDYRPESYLVYYGGWDQAQIDKARGFDLVILHPGKTLTNITQEQVSALQAGGAKVILYISIGEDEHIPRGPAKGDGEGPVYFDTEKGLVKEHKGYPSYYLDHRAYKLSRKGFWEYGDDGMPSTEKGHDGIPDENGRWNSYFVSVGDPAWQKLVFDKMHRMQKMFTPDGFFLDTLDAASEWGDYEWMQKDMAELVKKIGDTFPSSYIIGNRGLFLFERYPDLVRPALDGVMFESFITEWDWYRKRGTLHKWFDTNDLIMKTHLLPQAKRPDGFHLYMLNYLDPKQSDFVELVADMRKAMGDADYTEYYSTPDLQKIFPRPQAYFVKRKGPLPKIKSFSVKDTGMGRFSAALQIDSDSQDLVFGHDLFLDLRYTTKEEDPEALLHADRVELDYDFIRADRSPTGYRITANSFGLHNYKEHFFYARLRGRHPGVSGPAVQTRLITGGDKHPDIVTDLKAESRERAVQLSWKHSQKIKAFNVYMGAHPNRLSKVDRSKKPKALVKKLRNNDVYYFSAAAVDKDGHEGGLAYPIPGYPRKSVQPSPPQSTAVIQSGPGEISVTWERSLDAQVKGYRIYCYRKDSGLRLPLTADHKTFELKIPDLRLGKTYEVFVTTLDFDSIQSPPAKVRTITIE